ncbi:XrtX-associated membrane protein [Hymenobacter persicinus]|uniref:Uncharacterized protein n=1 Tax=Hymenobacter persicinus TaxID=2025506 RepID=A0A4Q5LCC9_9BACT|nr:hypothetical protein [Hymenobacter persicinus]RYU80292.1 hypothetical protein EWM57_08930 [Hymenobacter persicinus]
MPEPCPRPTFLPQPWRAADLTRWTLAALLLGALFGLGMYSDAVFAAIDAGWGSLLRLLGMAGHAATIQQGVSGLVTKRSLVSVGTYSLLYTALCLLLLAVVLNSVRRLRQVLLIYGGVFAACAVLVLVGLVADAAWAYKLARRLIDFIVSPLPVIILVPLLRWYQPQPPVQS